MHLNYLAPPIPFLANPLLTWEHVISLTITTPTSLLPSEKKQGRCPLCALLKSSAHFLLLPLLVTCQSQPISSPDDSYFPTWQLPADSVCKSFFPAPQRNQPATVLFIVQERKIFSGLEAPRWAATITVSNVSHVLYDQWECVFSFAFPPFGLLHLVNTGKVNVKMSALF